MKNILRALVIAALGLGLAAALARPDGRLHVSFLATPGDAVLIRAPGNYVVLIDGGADPALLALELGRRLPFWRRSLDAVVLTRPDGARLPGQTAALARYQVGLALAPAGGKGASYTRWRELLAGHKARVVVARPGARLPLGGATLTVLAGAEGKGGLALRLVYGRSTLLLAGALDTAQEQVLLREGGLGPINAAHLPWQREIDPALLARLRPQIIVYADGYKAKKPAELSYYERALGGAALYHEKNDGGVELISDGERFSVQTEGADN